MATRQFIGIDLKLLKKSGIFIPRREAIKTPFDPKPVKTQILGQFGKGPIIGILVPGTVTRMPETCSTTSIS